MWDTDLISQFGFKRIGKSDFYLLCTDNKIPLPDEIKRYTSVCSVVKDLL